MEEVILLLKPAQEDVTVIPTHLRIIWADQQERGCPMWNQWVLCRWKQCLAQDFKPGALSDATKLLRQEKGLTANCICNNQNVKALSILPIAIIIIPSMTGQFNLSLRRVRVIVIILNIFHGHISSSSWLHWPECDPVFWADKNLKDVFSSTTDIFKSQSLCVMTLHSWLRIWEVFSVFADFKKRAERKLCSEI